MFELFQGGIAEGARDGFRSGVRAHELGEVHQYLFRRVSGDRLLDPFHLDCSELRAPNVVLDLLIRGICQQDVESSIGRKISHSVVSDGRTVVYALNRGVPFVVAARQTRVSEDVIRIATAVLQGEPDVAPEIALRQIPKKGLFQWRAH